jgi:RNA polymerase sigma-70 factor (ECF subfamily)
MRRARVLQGCIRTSAQAVCLGNRSPIRIMAGSVQTLGVGAHPAASMPRTATVVPLHRPRRADDRSNRAAEGEPLSGGLLNARARGARRDRAEPGWAPAQDEAAELGEAQLDEALLGQAQLGEPDETIGADPAPAAWERPRRATVTADDEQLAAWLHRIARQDQEALETLYAATSSRVMSLVLRITRRHALAEEVLEETYWQVWRQAPRFDAERGRAITWLLAMARSRAIDALRREQRFVHEELPDADALDAAERSDAEVPPPDLLEATREHARLHAAVAALEPRARQLVALAFFRGLTHEEIAEQQALPLGTVKSLIRRALQQLRRVMENEHA